MIAYVVRPTVASFRYQVRINVTSPSVMFMFIFTPIIFGSVAVLFFSSYNASALTTRALLGSGVLAVWTTALMLSSITVGNERWSGVIELLLATPSRLGTIMLGKLLANSAQGLIAAAVAVIFISSVSTTTVSVDSPLLFIASILIAVVSIGTLAFAWSPILFVSRNAMGIFFMLDTGLVFISAIFYPLSTLPEWLHPISRLSPLRWASEALVTSAGADSPARDTLEAWGAMAALAVAYSCIGLVGFAMLERRLRRTGELSSF